MRIIKNLQTTFGEVDIENIEFNPKSRDEIDQLLKGLQALYCDLETRKKLFDVLAKMIPEGVNAAPII